MSRRVKLHRGIVMLLVGALLGMAGCGRSAARAGTPPSASAPQPSARNEPTIGAIVRPDSATASRALKARMLGVIARLPADTIRLMDARSQARELPTSEPTAHYASLEAACDSVESILRRAVAGVTGITLAPRAPVKFQYWYARVEAAGQSFRIEAADSCPNEAIEEGLRGAGWVENYGYGADGPDGSTLGFVSRDFLCLIEAMWDGGDDSDTTYVPQPGCQVRITCVPRRSDDALK